MNVSGLRFLVVEDHGFQRWMTANLVVGFGAEQVLSAVDGQEALGILATTQPPIDIVITDLDMPGMDGMEFIRRIAELREPVSLIVLSSMDSQLIRTVESMTRAYGATLLGAIEKPATAKKLEGVIARFDMSARNRAAPRQLHVHEAEPSSLAFSREEIASGLRNQQFEAFYQPKVDLKSRQLVGAEALARWRHPDKGIVAPRYFMDVMEKTELIGQLTETMLNGAAFNCRVWRDARIDVSIAVNLSLASLADVSLADRMAALVNSHGLEPRRVIFEVTESVAASDLGKTFENLSRLRMKGFGLSIDDYGTGYSSMERLSKVPFTELKIDQTFVRNALSQAPSRAMIESGVELAQKLGIAAVAEGVESQAEWQLLRDIHCPVAQGYFIASPMSAADFLEWARIRKQVTA